MEKNRARAFQFAKDIITTTVREPPSARSGFRFGFDRIAETYDRAYRTRKGRAYDALEKRAIKRILPRPVSGARLLDVGCGTGHWSAFFSERGYDVTGVDIAPAMIAVARGKPIPRASFQVADAQALPFPDNAFQVSAAIATLAFVRDAEAALDEMARCTARPGGTVIVGVLNALAPMNARRKAERKPPYAEARFFAPGEVKTMLARYGEPLVTVAAFMPRVAAALPFVRLTESFGRLLRSGRGAFIVGKVRL